MTVPVVNLDFKGFWNERGMQADSSVSVSKKVGQSGDCGRGTSRIPMLAPVPQCVVKLGIFGSWVLGIVQSGRYSIHERAVIFVHWMKFDFAVLCS